MREFARLSDLCWEGLTLKHVPHKVIVHSYLAFVFLALLFEVFLAVLYGVSSYLSFSAGYKPGLLYFVSGLILALMSVITVSIFITILKKRNNKN